jgi:hypothetical protein
MGGTPDGGTASTPDAGAPGASGNSAIAGQSAGGAG